MGSPFLLPDAPGKRREEAEGHVHRLEGLLVGVRDMGDERPQGRLPRRGDSLPAGDNARGVQACEETHGRGFDVPLHAGDLSGKEKPRMRLKPERFRQKGRSVEKGVPVGAAVAGELRVFQAGIIRKMRRCSGQVNLVWNPTML